MCFQESEAKDFSRTNICFKFLVFLTMCRMLMAPGRGCFAIAILLAIVDIQLGGKDNPTPHPQSRQPSERILDSQRGIEHMIYLFVCLFVLALQKKRTHYS